MSSTSAHISPELLRLLGDAAALVTARDRAALFGALDRLLDRVAPTDYLAVFLFDVSTQRLRLIFSRGLPEPLRKVAERTAMKRHPGWVFIHRQMLYVPDTARDAQGTRASPATHDVRSRLFFPILRRGESIGVLGIGSRQPDDFNQERIALFSFISDILSGAHNNITLFEELDEKIDVVRRQHDEIVALAAPILDIGRGVLLMPLIGQVDEARAARLCCALLEAVQRRGCRMVILDATSMSAPHAALSSLRDLGQSLKLMGVHCVLSGVPPHIAARLPALDTDLGATEIFSTVAEALSRVHE